MADKSIAVYQRNNPTKALMLLKPREQEVIYTPLGVQHWKLDPNNLPQYPVATHLLASDPNLVGLPYQRGREPDEIKALIAAVPQLADIPIIDIPIIDIDTAGLQPYSGQYGQLKLTEAALQNIIPCQKRKRSIRIDRAQRGTSYYTETIEFANVLGEFEDMTEGERTTHMGDNEEYIISTTISFNEIWSDYQQCDLLYYLIGLAHRARSLFARDEPIEMGHSMVIIIDKPSQTVEIFDPLGISPGTRHVYVWVNKLINYFAVKHNIQLTKLLSADEAVCPQYLAALAPEFHGIQECVVWAYYYLWLRINNPTVPRQAILRYLSKLSPSETLQKSTRIANLAFGLVQSPTTVTTPSSTTKILSPTLSTITKITPPSLPSTLKMSPPSIIRVSKPVSSLIKPSSLLVRPASKLPPIVIQPPSTMNKPIKITQRPFIIIPPPK